VAEQRDDQLVFTSRYLIVLGEEETSVADPQQELVQERAPQNLQTTSAKVVRLDDYRDDLRKDTAPAHIDTIYRDLGDSNPHLARAVNLLEEGYRTLNRALEVYSDGDLVAADDAVQEFQAILPELFLCRRLGDGFASIIAGLHFAFENKDGDPLSCSQIQMVNGTVQHLMRAPFISVTRAYELLAQLEETALTVTPKSLSYLFDDEEVI
jgi:hypothetical protein